MFREEKCIGELGEGRKVVSSMALESLFSAKTVGDGRDANGETPQPWRAVMP